MKVLEVTSRVSMWRRGAKRAVARALRVLAAALLLSCFCLGSALGQSSSPRDQEKPADPEASQGQSYAPIGDSGYKVPIPVIKMKSIVGETSAPKKASGPVAPTPSEGAAEQKKGPPDQVQRLPFQTEDSLDEVKTPFEPPSEELRPTREASPSTTSSPHIDETRKKEPGVAGGPVKGGPVEVSQPVKPPAAKEVAPPKDAPKPVEVRSSKEEQTKRTAPEKTPPAKEEEVSVHAPMAPREAIEPLPRLRKELLRPATQAGVPPLLEGRPAKSSAKPLTLKPTEADDLADPRGWIQLEPRKEPEALPSPEPEAVREPEPEPQPIPEEQPEVRPQAEPEPEPEVSPSQGLQRETRPAPETQPAPIPETSVKESLPAQLPQRKSSEELEPKEQAPPKEEVAPPVRESVASPLGDDVLENREVRDYLQQTAPILEEISLLMARAPSLTIEDYDPSDPNAAAIPKEIQVKMDTIKRDLQILDSKTFAIIPPTQYTRFHSLIRESITETHRACDAILSYLAENRQENLQKAKDHLLKARDLIQRTRERGEQT